MVPLMSYRAVGPGIPLLALLVGCGPTIVLDEDSDDETTDAMPGTTTSPPPPAPTTMVPDPPPVTTTTTTATTTSDESGVDDASFIGPEPDVPPAYQCDFFEQDCPPGEKCVPVNIGGGTALNALRCHPVVNGPGGPGDPCVGYDSLIGLPIDDCDANSMCLFPDEVTGMSVCHAFCVGSEESPLCEDRGSQCLIFNDPWGICFPQCDPLLQDCPPGEGCYLAGEDLVCAPDSSGRGGAPGTPCEFINACDPGTMCVEPSLVPDCRGGIGCCTSFCDVFDPMTPCLPGQTCEPVSPQMPIGNPGLCVLGM